MKETLAAELTQLGLTPTEAQVYLALLQNGPMGASAIAAATGLARTSVYPALGSLVDKGLVDAGEGYGSRFAAAPAERALPHLMASDKEALLQRERLTTEVIERISSLAETDRDEPVPEELIQVIRSPRAVAERFDRLQLEAERLVEVFCKPPFFVGRGNPAEDKALRRGVRNRAIYEKAALDEPAIKPYLSKWLAEGEEARIYDGELPHKLAIFDSKVALMPLIMPGKQVKAVLIQHPKLVQTLSLGFEYLWERSQPVASPNQEKIARPSSDSTLTKASAKQGPTDHARQRISRNGRRGQPAKK